MWGTCSNGTEAIGCGRPETFRNCADIRIVSSASGLPPQFISQFSSSSFYRDELNAPLVEYPQVVR